MAARDQEVGVGPAGVLQHRVHHALPEEHAFLDVHTGTAGRSLPDLGIGPRLHRGLAEGHRAAHDVQAIVKGLRAASDFDYELPMAQMNHALTGVETVFLPTSTGTSFVSSSLVKEVASFGGDVSAFLPAEVHEALLARIAERAAQPDAGA